MIKKFLLITFVIFVALLFVVIRPVPIVHEHEALVVKGTISSIYEGGVKDVVFTLKGDHRLYYINRGLELGLEIGTLRKQLLEREVVFKYPEHWSILDLDNSSIHISKVEFGEQVIFDELKK